MSRKSPPFSLRIPEELKEQAAIRAQSERVSLGCYICDAVRAQLNGKPVRRHRAPFADLRQELAKLHAAVIRVGNQLPDQHDVAQSGDPVAALKEVAASLLRLENAIRHK